MHCNVAAHNRDYSHPRDLPFYLDLNPLTVICRAPSPLNHQWFVDGREESTGEKSRLQRWLVNVGISDIQGSFTTQWCVEGVGCDLACPRQPHLGVLSYPCQVQTVQSRS